MWLLPMNLLRRRSIWLRREIQMFCFAQRVPLQLWTVTGKSSHESITPLLKNRTWAPVVVDPSHSVGHSDFFVKSCSLAVAYGADGLCIESHIDPAKGIGDDPKQAITPDAMKDLIEACKSVWKTDIHPRPQGVCLS